jgi:hypothetical protein
LYQQESRLVDRLRKAFRAREKVQRAKPLEKRHVHHQNAQQGNPAQCVQRVNALPFANRR